jgi:hypothetical protein
VVAGTPIAKNKAERVDEDARMSAKGCRHESSAFQESAAMVVAATARLLGMVLEAFAEAAATQEAAG